jgi:hypothetical protein
VADINGDGYSEILAVNQLYDGMTGKLLATLPTVPAIGGGRGKAYGGPSSYMPVFADIDNDGIQEIVAGNAVYKVIINDRNLTTANSIAILATAPVSASDGFASGLPDGFTSVADIDLDGDLDVIVTGGGSGTNTAIMYVWDGATRTKIGNTVTVSSNEYRISRPFVGDINGDGSPDIVFTWTNMMAAYSYNKGSNTFTQLWQKATTDGSGATTMSMFDFNQDGEVELVYRDQDNLRIIDKDGNNLTTTPCFSATHTEYPIIVDIDRDGHADILVSGSSTTPPSKTSVRLMRYSSLTPDQWAYSRSVWNQHAYNATNINEDLSIPKRPLNPAIVFPGADGITGTADDIRPYNNFLQQQTFLGKNGTPVWLLSDAKIVGNQSYNYFTSGDSLCITVTVTNLGDAALIPPFYVAAYKNSDAVANKMAIGSITSRIDIGDTVSTNNVIHNFSTYMPISDIVIRMNDN